MDMEIYLQASGHGKKEYAAHTLGDVTRFHTEQSFPDLDGVRVAMFGVLDDPGHDELRTCVHAPDRIRNSLYELYQPVTPVLMADLGNVKPGATAKDTIHAVSSIIMELIQMNIMPVILGGGQAVAFAQYLAYERLERMVNLVSIDPRFDLGNKDDELSETSYLGHIVLRQPNFLFNFSNIAYQTYLVDRPGIELMEKLYFDAMRLGEVRGAMPEAEPIIRNADTLMVDLTAIRKSDAPGTTRPGPNGLYAEEMCQLMRYAGISEKLSSIGIYEMDPMMDQDGVTAELVGQMIWCFLDGFVCRTNDLPWLDRKQFTKYQVQLQGKDHDLVFFKSKQSDRWWMDVPYRAGAEQRFERHHLVPCSYGDYERACHEEVPDRWWRTFQKLI